MLTVQPFGHIPTDNDYPPAGSQHKTLQENKLFQQNGEGWLRSCKLASFTGSQEALKVQEARNALPIFSLRKESNSLRRKKEILRPYHVLVSKLSVFIL
jgi:hypothetical protein